MTLLMAGDGSDSSLSSGSSTNQVVSDDDEENGRGCSGGGSLDEGGAVAVAPLRARCRGTAGLFYFLNKSLFFMFDLQKFKN